jgi:hypothetical protein
MQPIYIGLIVGIGVLSVFAVIGVLIFSHLRKKAESKKVKVKNVEAEQKEPTILNKQPTMIVGRKVNIKFSSPIHLQTLKVNVKEESKNDFSNSNQCLVLKMNENSAIDLNSEFTSKKSEKQVPNHSKSQKLFARDEICLERDLSQKSFESMSVINPLSPEKLSSTRRSQFEKQSFLNMNDEFYLNYIHKRLSPMKHKVRKKIENIVTKSRKNTQK